MHKCDNCEKVFNDSQMVHKFPDIPDMTVRIEPGMEVPSGECPECGTLTYVQKQKP